MKRHDLRSSPITAQIISGGLLAQILAITEKRSWIKIRGPHQSAAIIKRGCSCADLEKMDEEKSVNCAETAVMDAEKRDDK